MKDEIQTLAFRRVLSGDVEIMFNDKTILKFWTQVKKTRTCWNWTGGLKTGGYGTMHIKGFKNPQRCNRISWVIYNGRIPYGKYVLHRCDNRACVNPKHLFLGTHVDNMKDMWKKGRGISNLGDMRGENNTNSKLTQKDVHYIRKNYVKSQRPSLAKKYGVFHSTIISIVKRKTWANF